MTGPKAKTKKRRPDRDALTSEQLVELRQRRAAERRAELEAYTPPDACGPCRRCGERIGRRAYAGLCWICKAGDLLGESENKF